MGVFICSWYYGRMSLYSVTTTTPVGDFHMIFERKIDGKNNSADIVCASGFGDLQILHSRLPKDLQQDQIESLKSHPYQKNIHAYFAGDKKALKDIPYTEEGSDFTRKVWFTISTIKYGKTLSYKELAIAAGRASAFRAVGTMCGQNRLILLVPCHRVLKSDGSIGEYLYGAAIKEYLLKLEGAL